MSRPSNIAYHPAARPPADEDEAATNVAPLRRRLAKPARPAPAPSADPVDDRLHEELETLRRYIETATWLLGQDAALRYRYATELGNLKHVEKVLGQVGQIVAAADKAEAIERLADAELKARLQRKPIAPWFESKH